MRPSLMCYKCAALVEIVSNIFILFWPSKLFGLDIAGLV